jgi:hypothetical protein
MCRTPEPEEEDGTRRKTDRRAVSIHQFSSSLVLTSCTSLSSLLQGLFGWAEPMLVAQVVRRVLHGAAELDVEMPTAEAAKILEATILDEVGRLRSSNYTMASCVGDKDESGVRDFLMCGSHEGEGRLVK